MKDVIVTGGRNYSDRDKVKSVLDLFDIGALIQGGAKGADALALEYSKPRYITEVTIDADWDRHGKQAGPIRNRAMLDAYKNAVVVAFPGGPGTRNSINEALKRKMLVIQVL